MKRIHKRIFVYFILLALLAGILSIPASAATVSTGKRYNIMLVIDGSGSLESKSIGTDPDGMRYDLIDDLFGVLEDNGHNIGAIVFSGNKTVLTEDADMEKGILLNTGILSLDTPAPDGSPTKDYVASAVRNTTVDNTKNCQTDIGTALLVAQRELQEAQKKNGLESLVFLFTDGCTAITYSNVLEKSLENLNTATREMAENDIRLFGAFLNKDGKMDSSEMIGIVCAANNIRENSEEFAQSFVEIQDASSAHSAINTLMQFLGYIDLDTEYKVIYDNLTDTFEIPGIGVEEMNIRLYTVDGENLPDLEVKIIRPDGTEISGSELNAMCRSSRTIRVYKLVKPMSGTWTLNVTVPEGNEVGYVYAPVISLYIDSMVQIDPAPEELHVNSDASFTALLVKEGTVITDPAAYRGYDCTLEIVDKRTGDVKSYAFQPDENNTFLEKVLLEAYGTFDARVIFTCGKIEVISPYQTYVLKNNPPTTTGTETFKYKYGPFLKDAATIDLTQYFEDLEDGDDLQITILDDDCNADAYELDEAELQIDIPAIGDGSIELQVTDSQGESAELKLVIKTTNITIWYILAIILIVILILVVVLIAVYKNNVMKPDGVFSVSFVMPWGNGEKDIVLDLDVPGVQTVTKTNLNKLIQRRLMDDTYPVAPGVYAGEVKDFLGHLAGPLSDVIITKGVKRKGKKKVGAIVVKHAGKKQVLYNGGTEVRLQDVSFALEFAATQEQTSDPFNDPFMGAGMPDPNANAGPNLFDDMF